MPQQRMMLPPMLPGPAPEQCASLDDAYLLLEFKHRRDAVQQPPSGEHPLKHFELSVR